MATDLAGYRTALDAVLATAVDAATWTTAIKDQALRQALAEYERHFVYETSVTVTSSGPIQDLSGISAVGDILAVAYPWSEGADFAARQQHWRITADLTICLESATPQAGETLRVRYTKQHAIKDLDAATATTVPDRHQALVSALAASFACVLRSRQLSENPAIPEQAIVSLMAAAQHYRTLAADLLQRVGGAHGATWREIGL